MTLPVMGDQQLNGPNVSSVGNGDPLSPPDAGSNPSSSIPSQLSSTRSSIIPSTSGYDREWESSPMYLALSGRLAHTESAINNLSSQVAHLTFLVKAALPQAPLATGTITSPPVPRSMQPQTFAPFDDPTPQFFRAPAMQTAIPLTSEPTLPSPSSAGDKSISALTQQISALSTSVAQLQKLQQSQGHVSRENSFSRTPTDPNDGLSSAQHYGNLARLDARSLISGPLTSPVGRMISPASGFTVPNGRNNGAARDFSPVRPQSTRSFSTRGPREVDKWNHPTFAVNSISREWSPGPGSLGNGTGNELGSPTSGKSALAGQNGTNGFLQSSKRPTTPVGSALGKAPGGGVPGMTVTKWDQLGLKAELVRSIAKYG